MNVSFKSTLDAEIESVTLSAKERMGVWFEEPIHQGNCRHTIYDGYPFLFREAFPDLKAEKIRSLALAGHLFANALFAYDNVIDRAEADRAVNLFRGQAVQFEAYLELHALFAPAADFWDRFRGYMVEYARACALERSFVLGGRPWSEFTEPLALKIAEQKTGIAKTAIAGLVELAGDLALLDPLVASLGHYYVGRQMWDDVCDWKEDLLAGVPSLLLSRAFPVGLGDGVNEEVVSLAARSLFYEGHVQYVMSLAIKSLDRADALVAHMPNLSWRNAIAEVRRDCQMLLLDVDRIVSVNLERAQSGSVADFRLSSQGGPNGSLVHLALQSLIEEWRRGFGEIRHIMRLSNKEGFEGAQEYHFGDVFQRALVVDALCDAQGALGVDLSSLIQGEVDYICSQRREDGVGGWSYFPSVQELAPDADDLGQILQAFVRSGRIEETRQHCDGPLNVLLRDNAYPDGSIETWIVPRSGRTSVQERQAFFNETRWGVGPDSEVMANLLYGLHLYDSSRFQGTIRSGITFLLDRQDASGSWASRWYIGPYYGTYVVLRLLEATGDTVTEARRALAFLLESQRADGGWGLSGADSDPLCTALALLALRYCHTGESRQESLEAARKGLSWLESNFEVSTGWVAVPFIQPRMGETYASRTITNLFVLKAGLAWTGTVADRAVPA